VSPNDSCSANPISIPAIRRELIKCVFTHAHCLLVGHDAAASHSRGRECSSTPLSEGNAPAHRCQKGMLQHTAARTSKHECPCMILKKTVRRTNHMCVTKSLVLKVKARNFTWNIFWKVKQSHYRPGQPWGFREVVAPRFQDSRHMKVVRLSALRTGRLYHPWNIPDTHYC